ncbi:MAG: SPOR domain-containing protein [Krumholzibacteria bacterium]|nr:SPOR domain-containing protein [Candidatus Krumholzibacteria bacterium]
MKKPTRKTSRDGLLKEGTSRLAKTGKSRPMPRIMWLAIVVCVGGAVLLFRNQGGDLPTGIGERRSVVSVGADSAATYRTPRSGDVDLAAETRDLTPEPPAGGTDSAPATAPVRAESAPVSAPVATATPTGPAETAPRIVPRADGGWLVQVGSFGEAANADRAAAGLKEQGWDARVKVGNTSDGSMIHRVQIGHFASRQEAEAFIAQNRKDLAGAIAVHR